MAARCWRRSACRCATDFAPFLQKVRDLNPEAVFVFVGAGMGGAVMKQFNERGLAKAGIRMIGTGDVVDDDILNGMGDVALGVTTSFPYSAAHPSALNKKFVEEFKGQQGRAPELRRRLWLRRHARDLRSAQEDRRQGGGDLLAAMKGQIFREPARPGLHRRQDARHRAKRVHPQVEKTGGELYNVEFAEQKDVRDPR